jgi:hypothetical protein
MVEKMPVEAQKKVQEVEKSQAITSNKVVEEEVTLEALPHQGVQEEGIAFLLFLYVNEVVK